MRSRWTRTCERLVPEPYRRDVFVPCLSDLEYAYASRRVGRARFAISVLLTALECRRLAGRDRRYRGLTLFVRESRWLVWFRDLRQACRTLWRQPVFASTVVAILALGIGANVAVFSYIDAFLLAPMPVPHPDRLVRAYGTNKEFPFDVVSYPNYRDLSDGARSLELAAHAQTSARVGPLDGRDTARIELVTGNFFRLMELRPTHGRLLDPRDDEGEGAHPVVVVSDGWWRMHFAADQSALGRSIVINGVAFEIVGVAPPGFRGTYSGYGIDLWVPLSMQQQARPRGQTLANRGWGWLSMIGRLRPGADLSHAQGDLNLVAAALNKTRPPNSSLAFVVTPAATLPEFAREAATKIFGVASALTLLVLIVTCANLAGLMQSRLLARRRELAIRHALGAGRARMLSGWISESLVLAVAGGVAGLVLGRATTSMLAGVRPPAELVGDLVLDAPIDWRVVACAVALSIVTAAVFALLPGLSASRVQPLGLLTDAAPTSTGSARNTRWRRGAVVVQIAASVVLLLTTGLLVRSVRNLAAVDPGFDATNVGLVSVDARLFRRDPAALQAFIDGSLDRVRRIPGVVRADIARTLPLEFGQDREGFRIPGYRPLDGKDFVSIDETVVGAQFFATMGIPFVDGRTWDLAGPPSAVISETMARKFWPGRSAVGESFAYVGGGTLIVSGIVKDIANYGLSDPPVPFVYLPAERRTPTNFSVVVRTSTPVEPMLSALEREVASADGRAIVNGVTTFADVRQVPLFPGRALATVAGTFGLLALLLTAVGLYGVVSAAVSQRTREIGVRIALGAPASGVLRAVLYESMVLVIAGLMAGAAVGYYAAGALGGWLFGVGSFDARVYAGVAALLAIIAILATWAPARRASRIDPVVALRS